ncbi:MAG: Zn-ribbon domain-containing OB-fold protein [Chloroflexi bacterium]|nr:Zn-ribbon domain-containing OB-fold protein [Chloroflexota bacterium]
MTRPPRWDDPNEFQGHPLRDSDISQRRVLTTESRPHAGYAWDTGIALSRYLAGLKQGHLLGSRCAKCRRIVVPPRVVCEHCFLPMSEWVPLQDTGTVLSYSICYVAWDAQRVQEPEIPAVIQIDGASEGVGILHILGEVRREDIVIGMQFKAFCKPPRKRKVAITDIRYFKPLKGR